MTIDSDSDNTQSFVVPAKGTTVAHYEIIDKIGSGGMGDVYLAHDTQLDRQVALKFLPGHLCQIDECRARFKREAKAVAKLNHPNIVTIHEVSSSGDRPYFVMEHVQGESLHYFAHEEPLPILSIANLCLQICQGLSEAHSAGIIHRDIKAANIVVSNRSRVKILDFGLAAVSDDEDLTKTGSTLGTVAYMSPEQVEGEIVDTRTDLYSFGIVFYELLTGRTPFKRDSQAATFKAILTELPKPLNTHRNDAPAEFQNIVTKALEKEKEKRYQRADEIVADLKKIMRELDKPASIKRKQPSVVVLPFKDMSPQKDQEYFCDGIAEEIINALTGIKGLDVVARTSAFSFKGKEVDVREIGGKLNVETILEGSVRKAGNQLRVSAQLIKVSDGFHLWSGKFDREMEDLFAIQDEISLAIAEKMRMSLFGNQEIDLAKRHTKDLDAYSLYLKGRFFWSKRTEDGLNKAISCFDRAVDTDQTYALAYVGLADCYCLLSSYQILSPEIAIPKARSAAEMAMKLHSNLAESNEALGHVRILYDWSWSEAKNDYEKAIKLSDSYATAHQRYAILLTVMGQQQQAQLEIDRAQQLDPLSLIINTDVGLVSFIGREYSKAVDQYQSVIEMDQNFAVAPFALGLAYEQLGQFDDAIIQFEKAVALSGNLTVMQGALGHAYAAAGMKQKAMELRDTLIESSKQTFVSPYGIAAINTALQEDDKAFEWLEKSVDSRSTWLIHLHMNVDPRFDRLKSDSRFNEILNTLGLSLTID